MNKDEDDCQALDANVILRLLLGDVPSQQEAALNYIEKHSPVIAPLLALYETVYVLETLYQWPREKIINDLEVLLRNQHLEVQAEDVLRAALIIYQKHPKLAFADAVLAVETKFANCRLVTFDQKLAKQGGEHVQLAGGKEDGA